MIDQKINESLRELENSLRNIESAKKQVEKTVQSYNGLNNVTSEYVTELSILTSKIKILINSINEDYSNKINAFEKDRKTIIDNAKLAIQKLSDASKIFQESLKHIQQKLICSLILNILIFALILYILIK